MEFLGGYYNDAGVNIQHHTGTLPLLFEFPHGLEMKPFTFDELLDVGLSLFEEVMRYGVNCRYRPR